ncbi:MAG: leucyl/phenylalanyl-tRNA--protein transferase [Bacteriovoracaceae bacterium]|nr:leucyl/phenylalanyl-tRNA--protein transferase [Bacteriovoracaceae bacterium]
MINDLDAMPIIFPPVDEATDEGLVAIGGELNAETLLEAYRNGIFPWPISSNYPLTWFSPNPRGVLFVENLHVGRSLKKVIKKSLFEIKFNSDFEEIITCCQNADNRVDQTDTWITNQMKNGYIELNNSGHCFCVGAYLDGKLVGGIYGVHIDTYFAGESMFYSEPNASKVCLVSLIDYIQKNGASWLDTQMVTPTTEAVGAIEIDRTDFISLLKKSIITGP